MTVAPRPVKQLILFRQDLLPLPAGKIAAQVAHASLGAVLKHLRGEHISLEDWQILSRQQGYVREECVIPSNLPMYEWLVGSFVKVVLKVPSEEELVHYCRLAEENGFPCCPIWDEGRTCFEGEQTLTCASIGPWWADELDKHYKHLLLLNSNRGN